MDCNKQWSNKLVKEKIVIWEPIDWYFLQITKIAFLGWLWMAFWSLVLTMNSYWVQDKLFMISKIAIILIQNGIKTEREDKKLYQYELPKFIKRRHYPNYQILKHIWTHGPDLGFHWSCFYMPSVPCFPPHIFKLC